MLDQQEKCKELAGRLGPLRPAVPSEAVRHYVWLERSHMNTPGHSVSQAVLQSCHCWMSLLSMVDWPGATHNENCHCLCFVKTTLDRCLCQAAKTMALSPDKAAEHGSKAWLLLKENLCTMKSGSCLMRHLRDIPSGALPAFLTFRSSPLHIYI
ncbi:hypothetical protein HRR90_007977 [Exophiala dermatitidis]|nr:hypothetical protein HRR74_005685 [Exophiala dermatitidis]KAJ4554758.1 hypothetical protein HRR79_009334 [Exophiala dermatitidis]KAJ4574324.1 hypothetical protein HRR82_006598 [Exophiala dermatitidis]KAJ4609103.1 hypothetical protein HRR85_007067 [Exophiala dermatitidis]KAJ4643733.1 hypothetical protein HRR90_007977 [Exophiala dermatitidis]